MCMRACFLCLSMCVEKKQFFSFSNAKKKRKNGTKNPRNSPLFYLFRISYSICSLFTFISTWPTVYLFSSQTHFIVHTVVGMLSIEVFSISFVFPFPVEKSHWSKPTEPMQKCMGRTKTQKKSEKKYEHLKQLSQRFDAKKKNKNQEKIEKLK